MCLDSRLTFHALHRSTALWTGCISGSW
jgi:hypothetical protein